MSLQIANLVLYSRRGDVRELPFKLGAFNVLTGASKTGKSAIIDIVDYCTGRSECNVADGVIRKHVGWYAILFQLREGQIFIARRNPDLGEKTSPDIYMERGVQIAIPSPSALFKNTTVRGVEKFLGAAIGISENEHRPQVIGRNGILRGAMPFLEEAGDSRRVPWVRSVDAARTGPCGQERISPSATALALSGAPEAAPEGDHRLRHLLFGKLLVAYVFGKTPGEIIEPVAVDPQRIGELLHHAIR